MELRKAELLKDYMAIKNLSYKIVIRPNRTDSKKLSPVYMRVVYKGKKKDFMLYKVQTEYYSEGRVLSKHPNSFFFMQVTNIYVKHYNDFVIKLLQEQREFTFEELTKYLCPFAGKSKGEKPLTFSDYIRQEVEKEKHSLSVETVRHILHAAAHIDEYKKGTMFKDLSYNWMREFEQHLQAKNLHVNTVGLLLTKVKKYAALAVLQEILQRNPFVKFKIKKEASNRNFLSLEEVAALHVYLENATNKTEIAALKGYLFSVYTGCRYSEILTLKKEHISGNTLTIMQAKTKVQKAVPLSPQAVALMNTNNYLMLNLPDNTTCNTVIQQVAAKIGITKHLTFHTARHTFATLLLNKGGNISAISQMLGHTDLKTTQIYAKVTDNTKREVIDLFNKKPPKDEGNT